MTLLQEYAWPGNVRELQNYVERAVVMSETDTFSADLLPDEVSSGRGPNPAKQDEAQIEALTRQVVQSGLEQAPSDSHSLYTDIVGRIERELIAQVMNSCNQVQTKAATRLGINRNTLHKKLKEFGLDG